MRAHISGLLWVSMLLPLTACATVVVGDFASRTVSVDGGSAIALRYRIYVPAACSNRRCPLLLFYHGSGERGSNNTAQLNNSANGMFALVNAVEAAAVPMIVVAPQCPNIQPNDWWSNEGPLVGSIDMLDDVQREFGFDPARLYVTGLSMGGAGALGLASNFDSIAAAALPVCAAYNISSVVTHPIIARVPMWFFHAANDGTVLPISSREGVAGLRTVGADPLYTEFASGGHGIFPQSYAVAKLAPWLIAQRWHLPQVFIDPAVQLQLPVPGGTLYTNAGTVALSGTAGAADAAVSSVSYSFGASTGTATGTTSFTAPALPVPPDASTVLRAQATGTSYVAAFAGNTTFSRSVRVVHPIPAARSPRVVLWVEPVTRVGRPLRLRALVDDDDLPQPATISFSQLEGPATVAFEIDSADPKLAWWTPNSAGAYRLRVSVNDGGAAVHGESAVLVLTAAAPRPTARAINVGGAAMTGVDVGNGVVSFEAETGFTGGSAASISSGFRGLYGSEDDLLHLDSRRGTAFSYALTVPNGRYLAVLYLSNTTTFTNAARSLGALIEGTRVLDNYDIYSAIGWRQAQRIGFVTTVADGVANFDFARQVIVGAGAQISLDGIELLTLPAGDTVFANGFE
ncbi:MAG: malectin domain-containing carbohydrate-binding protein [Pseudomonadota bacterium]|nr:malectin domain-containing carbohydrate-binding protein [Pseudomonadota bacterium]